MRRNLWETIKAEGKGGSSLFLFVIGALAILLAVVLTVEDTIASYKGLISLQNAFSLTLASHNFVLWAMSIAPQVGQVVFIALWSMDTERKWALLVGIFWFVVDFVSDVQHHSQSALFPVEGGINVTDSSVWVAAITTMVFFTIGAELFLVAGTALVTMLYPQAKIQWALLKSENRNADKSAQNINRGDRGNRQPSQSSPAGNPRGQEVGRISIPHDVNDLESWMAEISTDNGSPVSRREARQRQGGNGNNNARR